MRLGALKYVAPLRYMGTKILANAFHATLFSHAMPRTNIPVLDLTRHAIAQPVVQPRVKSIRRVEKLAEWQPIFDHAPNRPPAVKPSGGLRGSTATRWR